MSHVFVFCFLVYVLNIRDMFPRHTFIFTTILSYIITAIILHIRVIIHLLLIFSLVNTLVSLDYNIII